MKFQDGRPTQLNGMGFFKEESPVEIFFRGDFAEKNSTCQRVTSKDASFGKKLTGRAYLAIADCHELAEALGSYQQELPDQPILCTVIREESQKYNGIVYQVITPGDDEWPLGMVLFRLTDVYIKDTPLTFPIPLVVERGID